MWMITLLLALAGILYPPLWLVALITALIAAVSGGARYRMGKRNPSE